MSSTLIVIVIVVVVVLIAAGVVVFVRRQRSQRLRGDFGSEYDREVAGASSRSAAEKDLQQRQKRHQGLNIRALETAEREGYRGSWDQLQGEFVDSPANAVRDADALVISIMRARGYTTDDFDQRAQDMSVENPEVVQHYREAHQVAVSQQSGDVDTEDLRKAAISYRSLVAALLQDKPADPQADRNGSATPPTSASETEPRSARSNGAHASAEGATTNHSSQA